jgi:hypothetical protein
MSLRLWDMRSGGGNLLQSANDSHAERGSEPLRLLRDLDSREAKTPKALEAEKMIEAFDSYIESCTFGGSFLLMT